MRIINIVLLLLLRKIGLTHEGHMTGRGKIGGKLKFINS